MKKEEIIERFEYLDAFNPKKLYEKNHHKWKDENVKEIRSFYECEDDKFPSFFSLMVTKYSYDECGEVDGWEDIYILIKNEKERLPSTKKMDFVDLRFSNCGSGTHLYYVFAYANDERGATLFKVNNVKKLKKRLRDEGREFAVKKIW